MSSLAGERHQDSLLRSRCPSDWGEVSSSLHFWGSRTTPVDGDTCQLFTAHLALDIIVQSLHCVISQTLCFHSPLKLSTVSRTQWSHLCTMKRWCTQLCIAEENDNTNTDSEQCRSLCHCSSYLSTSLESVTSHKYLSHYSLDVCALSCLN